LLSSAEIVAQSVNRRRALGQPGGASLTTIFQGQGWRVADILCCADIDDPPFEERHDYVSIALVAAGGFTYRSRAGTATLCSGSILLGSAEACFTCGHEHGAGDRCIAFQFSQDRFEEILGLFASPATRMAFPRPALPASRHSVALFADAEAIAAGECPDEAHDLALRVASSVIMALDGYTAHAPPNFRQAQRMTAIARRIEDDPTADCSLTALAGEAGMSLFHFVRCFKRVTGMTPHAFVRVTRLREAARLLRDPSLSIAAIAFEIGFEDLSVFNAAFRQVYRTTPRAMRARFAGRPYN
jgi:AraC family transcriptional regulator